MQRFLAREVGGVQVWVWLVGCVILAFFLRSAWAAMFFAAPAAKALSDGAKEMNERAQALMDQVEAQAQADAQTDAGIHAAGEEAKLKLILGYKEQQDDTNDPYMD